jgi:hypothetical protein
LLGPVAAINEPKYQLRRFITAMTQHQPHSTARRDLIRLATAAGAALGVPAIAVADPIYELIERHRETMRAWDASSADVGRAQGDWFGQRKGPFEKPAGETAKAIAEEEERQSALDDLEQAAADAIVETVPTTAAGMLVAIRYVLAYYDGESEVPALGTTCSATSRC